MMQVFAPCGEGRSHLYVNNSKTVVTVNVAVATKETYLLYYSHMFNKTFYKFLISFIAVIAGVLLFILVLGASSGIQ